MSLHEYVELYILMFICPPDIVLFFTFAKHRGKHPLRTKNIGANNPIWANLELVVEGGVPVESAVNIHS